MNKKVLTLCAGFLLAGSFASLDAEITKVEDPVIGSSYVLGTNIDEETGEMTYVMSTSLKTKQAAINQFGLEWTLEQAVDDEGEVIEGQFYLVSPAGTYVAHKSATPDGYLKLVNATAKKSAVLFKLDDNGNIVFVDQPTWSLIEYSGSLVGQANAVPTYESSLIRCVTYEATKKLGNNDIADVNAEYNFVAVPSADKDNASAKVLKYDARTKTVSLVNYSDVVAGTYGDIYDAYLWKVETVSENNLIAYKFTSRVDGTSFTFTADSKYAKGFNLVGTPFTGNEIVALYQSPLIYKTADELNLILTNGFEMTIKKSKDDTSVISGIDAFSGKLIAKADATNATRFQIMNEDGEYLVLNTKANWGTDNVGVNDRGHKFEWVAKDKVTSADYCSYFEFTYYAGAADEKIVENVNVYAADGTFYGSLFIQSGTENSNWLTTSNGKENAESWPYIILQSDNIVKINEVNERFLTFTYADTKVNAGKEGEVYKFGGMLIAKGVTNNADYVDATTIYEKAPESQWAVTDYNVDNGTFTLSNRESQEQITNVLLRWEDKAKGICTVLSSDYYFNNDLVKMTVVTDPTMFDGFAQYNESELRNNKFYLGQYHGVAGNSTAYFVENHGNSHQIGVTAEEDAAGKWNLRFATREKEIEGKNQTVVDTVFVTTQFYTLKADGTQETTPNKINTSKLAILPYTFQNADNREFVDFYEGMNLDYYYCNEYNKEYPENAIRFALKMKADGTYNFVQISAEYKEIQDGNNKYYVWDADKDYLSTNKMFVANSTNKGSLKQMDIYAEDNNSLMVAERIESPEYHQITTHAWGDTIRLFRGDNDSQVLYEKKDAKSVVAGETLSFLNVDNTNQFDINPSMFADTAYINRVDADGIKNTCYQYLLAVKPEFGYHVDNCNNPAHKPDVTNQIDTVYGRFLVNLIDTANMYGINNIHNNPYIIESEAGDYLAKLAFVNGFHTNDTLYIPRENADTVKLAMDTPDFNVAKFAFRYVDDQAKTFKIQTQYKEYLGDAYNYATEEDVKELYKEYPNLITNEGYLRWVNGTIAVVKGWENGDVFSIEEGVKSAPTANETINAANNSVVVAGVNGAVVVKGAEGKNVIVSTILGKVVANEVVSSDNAQIATPAGIVVVSVDGESFKVVVK